MTFYSCVLGALPLCCTKVIRHVNWLVVCEEESNKNYNFFSLFASGRMLAFMSTFEDLRRIFIDTAPLGREEPYRYTLAGVM